MIASNTINSTAMTTVATADQGGTLAAVATTMPAANCAGTQTCQTLCGTALCPGAQKTGDVSVKAAAAQVIATTASNIGVATVALPSTTRRAKTGLLGVVLAGILALGLPTEPAHAQPQVGAAVQKAPMANDMRDAMFAALKSPSGTYQGKLDGVFGDLMRKEMGSNADIFVNVTTVRAFKQTGCKRLRAMLSAPDVKWNDTKTGQPQSFSFGYEMNVCEDGSPPMETAIETGPAGEGVPLKVPSK